MEKNFYICKTYHSWKYEKNENTNGLIRKYIPKGSDMTEKKIKWIENKLKKIVLVKDSDTSLLMKKLKSEFN